MSNAQAGRAAPNKYAAADVHIDVADELLFMKVLDRFEAELRCVADRLPGNTEECAVVLPPYRPAPGQRETQLGL